MAKAFYPSCDRFVEPYPEQQLSRMGTLDLVRAAYDANTSATVLGQQLLLASSNLANLAVSLRFLRVRAGEDPGPADYPETTPTVYIFNHPPDAACMSREELVGQVRCAQAYAKRYRMQACDLVNRIVKAQAEVAKLKVELYSRAQPITPLPEVPCDFAHHERCNAYTDEELLEALELI